MKIAYFYWPAFKERSCERRKKVILQWRYLAYLCHVIKVNIISDKLYTFDMICWEYCFTSVIFCPNTHNSLIIRKHQINSKWVILYKISDQYFSKLLSSWKTREFWGTAPAKKNLKSTDSTCNVIYWTRKRILGKNEWNPRKVQTSQW